MQIVFLTVRNGKVILAMGDRLMAFKRFTRMTGLEQLRRSSHPSHERQLWAGRLLQSLACVN
jgi:hypothetical protein